MLLFVMFNLILCLRSGFLVIVFINLFMLCVVNFFFMMMFFSCLKVIGRDDLLFKWSGILKDELVVVVIILGFFVGLYL